MGNTCSADCGNNCNKPCCWEKTADQVYIEKRSNTKRISQDDRENGKDDGPNSALIKSPDTADTVEIQHAPDPSVAILLDDIPDFSHHNKKIRLETLEPFQYEANETCLPPVPAYRILESDAIYIGQWKNGLRHGRGEQYWPNGAVYQGHWRDDKREGKGRYISEEGEIYTGDWEEDKMQGKGKFVWPDGRSYQGEFQENKKCGEGVFEWSNGVKYEGPFHNNKQHGNGVLVPPSGEKKEGLWQDGKIIKWHNCIC